MFNKTLCNVRVLRDNMGVKVMFLYTRSVRMLALEVSDYPFSSAFFLKVSLHVNIYSKGITDNNFRGHSWRRHYTCMYENA